LTKRTNSLKQKTKLRSAFFADRNTPSFWRTACPPCFLAGATTPNYWENFWNWIIYSLIHWINFIWNAINILNLPYCLQGECLKNLTKSRDCM